MAIFGVLKKLSFEPLAMYKTSFGKKGMDNISSRRRGIRVTIIIRVQTVSKEAIELLL